MTANTGFKMSQGLEVLTPKNDKALPIPCNEWDELKRQIETLTTEPWLIQMIGSLLLGAALAILTSILTGTISDAEKMNSVISWAVCCVCAITGFLSLYFAHKEKLTHRSRATSIATQMNLIEQRFERN
ncbi:hypothetical protein [Aeromonas sp. 61P]|uniref:hypothetical protein n=1 Tax=Aeromonas sp. 61P TaxID=3452721 RepID=UPI003F79084D